MAGGNRSGAASQADRDRGEDCSRDDEATQRDTQTSEAYNPYKTYKTYKAQGRRLRYEDIETFAFLGTDVD